MWSIMNSMGNPTHTMGPFKTQTRDFSLNVQKLPIVPGKTFANPNFVVKHYPSVHNHRNNFVSIPAEKVCHSDSSNTNSNSALVNSSQSLVDTLKEHHLDTVKTPEPKSEVTQPLKMCSKNRSRKSRRNRRRKTSQKNNPQKYIKDMMDVEVDIETPLSCSDISISPKIHCNTFDLTDFIVQKPCKVSKAATDDKEEYESEEEELLATIISVSPSSISKTYIRERQVSVSESEDSFIVFDEGTDEESESCEQSSSEEEIESEEEEEGEDEVDFTSPAIPIKKVRFAEDSDLCRVHTMVQWSFAYQQARKGHWEEYARDRDRFNRRAADIEKLLVPVFDAVHRSKVYNERFKDGPLVNL